MADCARPDVVMTEHPSWQFSGSVATRLFATGQARTLVTIDGNEIGTMHIAGGQDVSPIKDCFTLPSNGDMAPELVTALGSLGTVARYRNDSLWCALGTGIMRQVIRAAQSKKLYRSLCQSYGERTDLPGGGDYVSFPSPKTILELTDEQFSDMGMAFKRRALRSAATAYLSLGTKWAELAAPDLMAELQSVPGIGAWTAGAAVADWSNDWSLYPYADLAVRTWARRAAPAVSWPTDEPAFARLWLVLTGEHLSTYTLLTLAWGSHHGDIG